MIHGAEIMPKNTIEQQIQKLTEQQSQFERNDDLKNFLQIYDGNIICMPEYQPSLYGVNEVEAYYREIFQRQKVKSFQRKAEEFHHLGNTIVVIGNFKKEYASLGSDSLITQNGKYWHVWKVEANSSLKLKGETFGFFHPISNPAALVVKLAKSKINESNIPLDDEIPFELKAYSALMEKGVRERNGVLRAEFFTPDAKFFPFANTPVSGIDELKPYLIAYNQGEVKVDSISVYTYHSESLGDYILEYTKFRVAWTVPKLSGKSAGNGIRIWKRQPDKSLKIYRETGTHNHLD
jgi:ketosteroid isomerase-like protein